MVRKARAAVRIPEEFIDVKQPLTVKPAEVEAAFVKANPGLSEAGIAVACSGRRLSEVRICMTRDFGFRDCAEIDRRACTRAEAVMPPVRASRAASVPPR
jgi:ribonuclease T2